MEDYIRLSLFDRGQTAVIHSKISTNVDNNIEGLVTKPWNVIRDRWVGNFETVTINVKYHTAEYFYEVFVNIVGLNNIFDSNIDAKIHRDSDLLIEIQKLIEYLVKDWQLQVNTYLDLFKE